MSDRPLDIDLTKNTETRVDSAVKAELELKAEEAAADIALTEVDPEFAKEIKSQSFEPSEAERLQYRHKLAQVLDRTITVDRLGVELPANLEGFWCSNDGLSIAQYELKGWKVDTDFASRNSLHDIGDGKGVIADVIHMVRPKWMGKEENDIKLKNYVETHLKDPRKQKEERDFLAQNELPPLIASRAEKVSGLEIEESIKPKVK